MAPQRHIDPFATTPAKLNPQINPYVEAILKGEADGDLPVIFGEALRGSAGGWKQRIANFHQTQLPERLIVEIGCHKGTTLIEMASRFPQYGFIGIDITYKRVVLTAQRAMAAGLKNVYCALVNANGIDQIFAPDEMNGLVIFFPDPWIKKKRQAKNRLVSPDFTAKAAAIITPGGFVWFKTDQKPYFDAGGEALTQAGLAPLGAAAPVSEPLLASDFSSSFERRFHAENLPTYGGYWQRQR